MIRPDFRAIMNQPIIGRLTNQPVYIMRWNSGILEWLYMMKNRNSIPINQDYLDSKEIMHVNSMGNMAARTLSSQNVKLQSSSPQVILWQVFLHNIGLYRVRIHVCCKKDTKLASGLRAQKPKNPKDVRLCKAHVVSRRFNIYSTISLDQSIYIYNIYKYL